MNNLSISIEVLEALRILEIEMNDAKTALDVDIVLNQAKRILPNDYDFGNYIRAYLNGKRL